MTAPVKNPIAVVSQGLHIIGHVAPNVMYIQDMASPITPPAEAKRAVLFVIQVFIVTRGFLSLAPPQS